MRMDRGISNNRTEQKAVGERFVRLVVSIMIAVCVTGCASNQSAARHGKTPASTDIVTSEIGMRADLEIVPGKRTRGTVLPPGLGEDKPLSLDDAILSALQNNDAFHATLAQMGMADGDFLQSSLLTNPNLNSMIPVSVKQWEWTLFVPIESFLLRPERMNLTDKDRERVANQLVQTGLTLVRDVQVGYANLALATEQHQLALEALQIRQDLVDLTEKRLKDGDIAELEAIQSRVDALNAKANAALLEQNVTIARQNLAILMGIPEYSNQLNVVSVPDFQVPVQTMDELISIASANRPDLIAAQWAVATAEARCRLARKAWWRFDAVADYNGNGEKGPQAGPGIRLDIPIFNKNEGGVMRACAELEAAKFNRDQIQDQIVQQVRVALTQAKQARENLNALKTEVLPTLDDALAIAKKGFEGGGASYLLVLQTTTQYIDVKGRMLDQAAAICRARAELDLSCGGRLR
jgi:cobalt-zinc-cadmium efflux system outer membrane protein